MAVALAGALAFLVLQLPITIATRRLAFVRCVPVRMGWRGQGLSASPIVSRVTRSGRSRSFVRQLSLLRICFCCGQLCLTHVECVLLCGPCCLACEPLLLLGHLAGIFRGRLRRLTVARRQMVRPSGARHHARAGGRTVREELRNGWLLLILLLLSVILRCSSVGVGSGWIGLRRHRLRLLHLWLADVDRLLVLQIRVHRARCAGCQVERRRRRQAIMAESNHARRGG